MAAHRAVAAPVTDADRALPRLPATAWAVLGILSFGREMTGYDIRQWSEAILRFFYVSPATSQIYTELRRLSDLGLVSNRTVARDEARDKRVYVITAAGTEALERWQTEVDAEAPIVKDGVMLRVWLGHLAEPERLRSQVLAQRERLVADLADARSSRRGTEGRPEWEYPALVVDWTCRRIEAEIDLADAMLRDLDRLRESRTGPVDTNRTR